MSDKKLDDCVVEVDLFIVSMIYEILILINYKNCNLWEKKKS